MRPELPPTDLYEDLLGAVGDHVVVLQDLLDAGYTLGEVEELSGQLADGNDNPVTVAKMASLRDDPTFADVAARSLPFTLGRLRREFS